MRSPRRWITSVGTWIAGSTARTSMSWIIWVNRRNALGFTAMRSNRPRTWRARAEWTWLGRYHWTVSPCPHRWAAMSRSESYISWAPCPQGYPAAGNHRADAEARISAVTRSGYVAANRMLIGAPSE